MLEVQNGKAILWGIGNNGTPVTISGYASFILQNGKLDHKFKLTAIEDETEFDACLVGTNGQIEATITWTPSGATRADALAGVAAPPAPLQKVTTANFALDQLNGDWIYVGDASIDVSHAAGKMSIKLRRYVDPTQNASLSTTVSG